MKSGSLRLLFAAVFTVGLLLLVFPQKLKQLTSDTTEPAASRYHCPMHPTYTSDRPGDCPLCGMRLVPIAKSGVSNPSASLYVCPMHPEVTSDHPAECPKCGMDLVLEEKSAENLPGHGPAIADQEGLRQAGVEVAAVAERHFKKVIRAAGTAMADEGRISHFHTKVAGVVEKLHVTYLGQEVLRGQPLLDLYSQDLLLAQQELLQALASSDQTGDAAMQKISAELAAAARRKLLLFDVPSTFIEELERTRKHRRTVTLLARTAGLVTAKMVYEGQQVDPGMELLTLADLSKIWVKAAVYEHEAKLVRPGQRATLYFSGAGLPPASATIIAIDPALDLETRTLGIRFNLPNPGLALRPGMFAEVRVEMKGRRGLAVPEAAVMDTGLRQLVYVEQPPGTFHARKVTIGMKDDGYALIESGLALGEKVATKGLFLLDSESRIRGSIDSQEP